MKVPNLAMALLLITPSVSRAQHLSAAEARFNEASRRGRRLHDAGQHEQALRVFLGARTQFAGTPTELLGLMAQEQIETGRLTEGLRNATECVLRAETDVSNPRASTFRGQCVRLLEAVRTHLYTTSGEARVGAVQIDAAPESRADLVVRVGGQEIPRSLWGRPLPVPEGRVMIQLSALDASSVRREVRIAAAQRQLLVVGTASSTPAAVESAPLLQIEAPQHGEVHVATTAARRTDPGYGEVVVRVVDPPDGAGVALGGFDLPRVWWGHPFPVRPGVVQVDADAQGHVRSRQRVRVAAGQRAELTLTLRRMPPDLPVEPPPVVETRRTPWLAIAALGLGVGAAATGAEMFGLAHDRQNTLDGSCLGSVPRTECDPSLRPLAEQGATMTTAGNVLTTTGGILAAAGIVGWIVWSAQHHRSVDQDSETARMARRVWGERTP